MVGSLLVNNQNVCFVCIVLRASKNLLKFCIVEAVTSKNVIFVCIVLRGEFAEDLLC